MVVTLNLILEVSQNPLFEPVLGELLFRGVSTIVIPGHFFPFYIID